MTRPAPAPEDAAVKLYAIALALAEAADGSTHAPILLSISAEIMDRAASLAPDADDIVREIAQGLLVVGRALLGVPFGSNRLDYLLCGLATGAADWAEPLKRRKEWLRDRCEPEARRARGEGGT